MTSPVRAPYDPCMEVAPMNVRRMRPWMIPAMMLVLGGRAAGEFGDPIAALSPAELQRFAEGRAAFEETETAADGLGPVFNGTSCAACHSVGGTGGGSETLETRFGTLVRRTFDPLESLGGSLIQ